MNSSQDNGKLYTCKLCGQIFTKASSLSRHKAYSCKNNPNKKSRYNKEKQNASTALIPVSLSNISHDTSLKSEVDQLKTELNKLKNKLERTPNCFNIEKINIYITDPIDFIDVFTKRLGSRQKAIDYIKSKVNHKVEGDVSLFCDIYLNGDLDTWPISCYDKKHLLYMFAQPNQEPMNDPGGQLIYKHFRNAYANTLLRISNEELMKTFKYTPGTEEYETQRDILMDDFDLNLFQKKAQDLYLLSHESFVKKLAVKCAMLEKSQEMKLSLNCSH